MPEVKVAEDLQLLMRIRGISWQVKLHRQIGEVVRSIIRQRSRYRIT